MSVRAVGIPAEVAAHATNVWAYVERALFFGSMDTVEALQESSARGDMQLWAAFRESNLVGGFVTEAMDRPLGRVCVIVAAAGEGITADGCESVLEQITPWARSLGCEQFEINGRKGWGKHLNGWELAHTTYRRAIE